jgi:phosphogluconate dehydratase
VISHQNELKALFERGELDRDCVVVARFQGPTANGMPELHQLMPILGVLQDRGHAVALVTDGRLSGASGKVPAAIHVTPEASKGGVIGRVQDGDLVAINVASGELNVMVDEDVLAAREQARAPASPSTVGRALFAFNRNVVSDAESGGCTLFEAPVLVDESLEAATQAVAYGHCVS